MKKTLTQILSIALLLATVLVVEFHVGWSSLFRSIQQIPLNIFLLLSILSIASYLLRALRVQIAFDLPLQSFSNVFHLSTQHNFWNIMLPMRAGELSFPLLMKKDFSIDFASSTSHLLLFRLLDLLALMSVGILVYVSQYSLLITSIIFIAIIVIFAIADPFKLLLISILAKSNAGLIIKLHTLLDELPTTGKTYLKITLLTFLIWIFKLSAFVGLCWQLSNISVQQIILSVVAADLSSVLPIHGIAGTGTFEGAFVLSGKLFQESTELLLASAVQLHLYLLFMATVVCALSWLCLKLHNIKRTTF